MSGILMPQRDIGEVIMTAINEVGHSEGASLDDIEQYLKSTLNYVPDLESIQSSLNNAVANGLLLKLDNGKYKINSSEEQTAACSENANSDDKVLPKLHNFDLNKARLLSGEITKYAKEKAQEAERAVEKAAEDKNRNAGSDRGKVSSVAEKEYANVPLPHEDCKNKATARNADDFAKKDVQKVERTADRVAQDTNQAADSDTRNIGTSMAKEEKANVSLPDDDDITDIEKMLKDVKMKK